MTFLTSPTGFCQGPDCDLAIGPDRIYCGSCAVEQARRMRQIGRQRRRNARVIKQLEEAGHA
jgi:hypothetical protein